MKYFLSKTSDYDFDTAIEKATAALKEVGFGILTEIDMAATLKKKLDVDMKPYKILGACNPGFAHKAVQAEEKIGILLPCNVVVNENADGKTDISIMDPAVAMSVVENPALEPLAEEVRSLLEEAMQKI